ncbi:MAG: hypothetical protein GY822_04615 [Deltaproteobacteria bacterium]|nr:hypothetical protein [Deltaproteobacteria bacterium]
MPNTPLLVVEDLNVDVSMQHDIWDKRAFAGVHLNAGMPFGGVGPYGHDEWGSLEGSAMGGFRFPSVEMRTKLGALFRKPAHFHSRPIPWLETRMAMEFSFPKILPGIQNRHSSEDLGSER